MLSHLSVRNFALIDRLDIELDRGFVAVTGETGAGKSIVFDAVSLLIGSRATTDVIRSGEDTCIVQGMFEIDAKARPAVDATLDEAGIPSGPQLLVRRTVSRKGSNKVYLNDTLATVALLERVLDPLVEVVGQHEHLTLVRPDTHRELVDRFAGLGDQAKAVRGAHREWRAAVAALTALHEAREARGERLDFLRFQLEELRALELREGEADELEAALRIARNSEKLREAAQSVSYGLNDADGSAVEKIADAIDSVNRVASADPQIGAMSERLQEALAIVEDVAREARAYARELYGGDDLDTLELRDQKLRRAFRKYGLDEAGLIAKIEAAEAELSQLQNFEVALGDAEKAVAATRKQAEHVADALDKARRAAAERLFGEVVGMLNTLGMERARLELRPLRREELTPHGWDGFEVLFSANAGEPPGPIGRIASGGELSRLMLALKTAVSSSDRLQTYTFDEVDTGIGGATAEIVGQLLRRLANDGEGGRQVLCVTHHPQIASYADVHLRAEKTVADGRTFSRLVRLSPDGREQEIGRMLGGVDVNDVTLSHARAMLAAARGDR